MSINFAFEHQQRINRLLEFGLDESAIHMETIYTGATPGPTYLSAHPDFPSVIQPHMVTIQCVDELKRIGGIPDDLYENGLMQEHHNSLEEWNPARNRLEKSELTVKERDALCYAFKTYMFGNSKKVQSYKDAINQYYFPMQLALFAAKDVVVDPEHPLKIESQGDTPVVVSFNTVTVKRGGVIENQALATWEVNQMVLEDQNNPVYNFINIGTDGGAGGTPSPQGKAGVGDKGSNAVEGDKCCKTKAGQGGKGQRGADGKPGVSGENGGDTKEVVAKIKIVDGPLVALSVGGNGGVGGKGGKGGTGGDGGPGGNGTDHCSGGEQGPGGDGGDGGTGGKGGDGGSGSNVYIYYETLGPSGSISLGDPTGHGQGAKGGDGGEFGSAGTGNPNGADGHGGDGGPGGKAGAMGTIYVNNQPIQ